MPSKSSSRSASSTSSAASASSTAAESQSHDTTSSIITASIVVGFLTLAATGVFLFLKITRSLRARRERKRRKEALKRKGASADGREKHGRRWGRNAFEEIEWEGVPA